MLTGPALDDIAAVIISACRSGSDPDALRATILPRLRQAVSIDALWWAAVDPATGLFTRAYREELPAESGPYFVENEFLRDDVNKWTTLAQGRAGVGTLFNATEGHPESSERYRDIFQPMGLQDELRAVLRARGNSWGYVCLHRETAQTTFSTAEVRFMHRIAPHLAEGLHMGLLRRACDRDTADEGPGLVLLAADGALVGMNHSAGRWLEELGGRADGTDLPIELRALATRLIHQDDSQPLLPRLRVRTASGHWAVLHASWFTSAADATVAIIIENADPAEVAPIIMSAYGLTPREKAITALVCRGLSTRAIAESLHLTTDTVQDHLKSVYDRVGVHSRGELVAAVFQRDYLPRAMAGHAVNTSGAFSPLGQPAEPH